MFSAIVLNFWIFIQLYFIVIGVKNFLKHNPNYTLHIFRIKSIFGFFKFNYSWNLKVSSKYLKIELGNEVSALWWTFSGIGLSIMLTYEVNSALLRRKKTFDSRHCCWINCTILRWCRKKFLCEINFFTVFRRLNMMSLLLSALDKGLIWHWWRDFGLGGYKLCWRRWKYEGLKILETNL